MTESELLEVACPLVGRLGAVFYSDPITQARGEELGLAGFPFYFLGRGGMLGDVEAPAVASAFGYFEPGMVRGIWEAGRAVLAPSAAGRAHLECAADVGRRRLCGVPGLEGWCAAADRVLAAADPAGLALFAGVLGFDAPDDEPGRAMHQLVALRELRGSVHLLAVVASGLSPRTAHLIKRPGDYTMFGWPADDGAKPTDDDHRRYAEANELTDRLLEPVFGVLDQAARARFVGGLVEMASALGVSA